MLGPTKATSTADDAESTELPRVLVVCTANRCRSPMVASLLDERLHHLGLEVEVNSVGLIGDGEPPANEMILAMSEFGIDLSMHRSRRLEAEDVDLADLVIGLERRHVREVVLASASGTAWRRTFTLRELVRRGTAAGPRQSGMALATWLSELQLDRRRAELLGASARDDIDDPTGGSIAAYRTTATMIAELVQDLVGLVWPGAVEDRSMTAAVSAAFPTALFPPPRTASPGLA